MGYNYIHHVSGRLRVKNPKFRMDQGKVAEVQKCFENIDGILAIKANPWTGSLLFLYDPSFLNHTMIITQLKECGFLDLVRVIGLDETVQEGVRNACEQIGRFLLNKVVGYGLQGTKLSFLTAIL